MANQRKRKGETFYPLSPLLSLYFLGHFPAFQGRDSGKAPNLTISSPLPSIISLSPLLALSLSPFDSLSLSIVRPQILHHLSPLANNSMHAPANKLQRVSNRGRGSSSAVQSSPLAMVHDTWEAAGRTTEKCRLQLPHHRLWVKSIPLGFLFVMVPSIRDESARIDDTYFRTK